MYLHIHNTFFRTMVFFLLLIVIMPGRRVSRKILPISGLIFLRAHENYLSITVNLEATTTEAITTALSASPK